MEFFHSFNILRPEFRVVGRSLNVICAGRIPIFGHINVPTADWDNFWRELFFILWLFSFKSNWQLKIHFATHTEKKFNCTQCEKAFRQRF